MKKLQDYIKDDIFKYQNVRLTVDCIDYLPFDGKFQYCYTLTLTRKGEYKNRLAHDVIFTGKDFYAPAYYKISDIVMNLLSFLTLQAGDTDSEYFDGYTAMQWDFTNSSIADDIRLMIYDYETREDK